MNVVCSRCSTKYEFDDALVSRRGTSVKCTNCGHRFRVFPPSGVLSSAPDQWLIRNARGGSFRFENLRDLQRALSEGVVTVADEISRDGVAFRPIHSVPELESFFPKQKPKPDGAPDTLVGVQPPKRQSAVPRPKGRSSAQPTPAPSPPSSDFDDEEDVTAVYSSEQLEKLRPMRSMPQGGGKPALASAQMPKIPVSPIKVPASKIGSPEDASPKSASPKSASPKSASPKSGAQAATSSLGGKLQGSPLRAPAEPAHRFNPAASLGRASSKPPSAPKRDVRVGAPLTGTPTIALTGDTSNTQLRANELDTVRPPPGTPEGEAGLASTALRDDEPTRVGNLQSLLGKSAQENAVIASVKPWPAPVEPFAVLTGRAEAPPPPRGAALQPAAAPRVVPSAVAPSQAAPIPPVPVRSPPAPATAPSSAPELQGDDAPPALRRRVGNRRNITTDPATATRSPSEAAFDADAASSLAGLDEFPEPSSRIPQRSNLRWVFGLLLIAGVGVIAATVGKDYLAPFLKREPSQAIADARIDSMLQAGYELYREGDIDGAQEHFDRATGVAESHPSVVEASLLVLVTKCDVPWLEVRLHPEGSAERSQALDRLGTCSRSLDVPSNRAVPFANDNPDLNALLIDSYRIRGQVPAARQRASALSAHAAEPKAAYALAMLDLSDDDPGWSTVIERLRLALGGEHVPSRAAAAVVYALARSGDVGGARAAVANMDSASRRHPLLSQLAAFVETRAGDAAEPSSTVAPKGPVPVSAEEPPAGDGAPVGDPMKLAEEARRRGDKSRAERHFQEALQLEPGNVAALTGLGDIARARGNSTAALSHYHAALRSNPGYLPALVAVADLNWAHGDRAEAVKYYRRIGDGSPHSSRARSRIAEHEARGASGEAPKPPTPRPEPVQDSPEADPRESEPEKTEPEKRTEPEPPAAEPADDPEAEVEEAPPKEELPPKEDPPAPPGPPPGPKPRNAP